MLSQGLSKDGITYLLAVISKCIQDNSNYKQGKTGTTATFNKPGTLGKSNLKSTRISVGAQNVPKTISEIDERSDLEYYDESDEDNLINLPGTIHNPIEQRELYNTQKKKRQKQTFRDTQQAQLEYQ